MTALRKTLLTALFALWATAQAHAQTEQTRLISPTIPFFVPHWHLGAQIGAAADVGEGKLGNLISPALQLTGGYDFTPVLGARAAVSGLWARNVYAFPTTKYKWNFIQPSADLKVNLTNLIMGWEPLRNYAVYGFAGLGIAYTFHNDDAVEARREMNEYYRQLNLRRQQNGVYYNPSSGSEFDKLWDGGRWNPVFRAGLGGEYYVTDDMAITLEGNVNVLPDHFNSKKGKNDNRDWHFNALVGVRFNLGPSKGLVEPTFEHVVPAPLPPRKDPRTQDADLIALTEYVQFIINTSYIRENQHEKLFRVLRYLNEHPESRLELTGFADKDTGTPTINERLSDERARAVTQFMVERGISRNRISAYHKGDRVQPFDLPEDNRVTICIVIDEGIKQVISE